MRSEYGLLWLRRQRGQRARVCTGECLTAGRPMSVAHRQASAHDVVRSRPRPVLGLQAAPASQGIALSAASAPAVGQDTKSARRQPWRNKRCPGLVRALTSGRAVWRLHPDQAPAARRRSSRPSIGMRVFMASARSTPVGRARTDVLFLRRAGVLRPQEGEDGKHPAVRSR